MSSYTRIVLVVALACFASMCQGQDTELDLEIKGQQVIEEGQDTTIECTITNNQVGGFLRWEKVYRQEDGTTATIAIGTNGQIEKEFQSLQTDSGERRYMASMIQVEDTRNYIATLMLKGVKAEDGGRYTCALPSIGGLSRSVDITVQVQPSYLEFHVSRNSEPVTFEDGEELVFEKEDTLSLSCIVKGGYPTPVVKVTVGDQDITNQFSMEEVDHPEFMDIRGLAKTTYDVTLKLKEDLVIDYKHSKQEVSCQAKLPKAEDIAKSASFKIKMSGVPPIFQCADVVYSNTYKTDINITCNVRAEPMIKEAYVYFYKYNLPDKHIVKPGESIPENFEMKEIVIDEENQEASLTIVFPRIYGNLFREYTFVATSEVGTSQHTVLLDIDEENEPDFSAARRNVASLLAVLLVALHLIFS
jgi:hypothetical protein